MTDQVLHTEIGCPRERVPAVVAKENELLEILSAGNESYTGGDILRRLAKAGFKIAPLDENDARYLRTLLDLT